MGSSVLLSANWLLSSSNFDFTLLSILLSQQDSGLSTRLPREVDHMPPHRYTEWFQMNMGTTVRNTTQMLSDFRAVFYHSRTYFLLSVDTKRMKERLWSCEVFNIFDMKSRFSCFLTSSQCHRRITGRRWGVFWGCDPHKFLLPGLCSLLCNGSS